MRKVFITYHIAYIRYAKNIYKRKHAIAYHRVRRFKDELEQLEKLYEKEDSNE